MEYQRIGWGLDSHSLTLTVISFDVVSSLVVWVNLDKKRKFLLLKIPMAIIETETPEFGNEKRLLDH